MLNYLSGAFLVDLWRVERELAGCGFELVCGVDEAGRGPLAGPVFAAAVILPLGVDIPGLGDSKKLSEKVRDRLYDEIIEAAVYYGIASADHTEIDELNILRATFLAMNRAIDSLPVKPDIALIDGNREPGAKCRCKCIVGGDGKSASIAAASNLAKVSRDRFMAEMAERYPQYAFEKHKGYGTKLHYERLREHGPSEIHRATFLRKLTEDRGKRIVNDSLRRGELGERLALEYLLKKNYTCVDEGFRSRFGEIDLIVKDKEFLVFVEVKLRKDASFAQAREFVGKDKQRKMTKTAQYWLATHRTKLQPRFDVIEIYAPDDVSTPEIVHIENAF